MLHISPKWFALTSVIAGLVFAASARAQVVPRVPQAESKAPAPSAKLSGNRSAAQGSYLAVPGYWVLGMPGVQKEVGLTDQQKQSLKAISDKYQAAMRKGAEGLQGLAPEEQEKRMEELRAQADQQVAAARKQVEGVLTPQQLKTIERITFSMQAAAMLANPQVQQQIGMSDAQKQQLERIYDQMRETIEQLQRDTAGKVLNLLTPEQQAALRKQAAAPQPRQ